MTKNVANILSKTAVALGIGRHILVVPLPNAVKLLQVIYHNSFRVGKLSNSYLQMLIVAEVVYTISLVATKISILLLYRSIFPGRGFALATDIVGAFVLAWGIAVILVSIFSCNPVRGFWDFSVQATCINTQLFYMGNSVPNIAMDVIILSLPIKNVWDLQMSMRQKFVVSGLFLLGGW